MSRLYTPAETLRRLRNRMGHICADDAEIRRVFHELFLDKEFNFAYQPYIFQYDRINRATKHIDENWFSDPDGNPLIERLHCPAPPTDRVYTFKRGRCNMDNESMFYGASENGVPIFEIQAKKGYFVVVSSWAHKLATLTPDNRPSRTIDVNVIALGVGELIQSMDKDEDLYHLLTSNEPYFSPSTPQEVRDVDDYIGKVFAEKGSDEVYQFTSTLSNILFNEFRHNSGTPIDGLIYPSVESKKTGHNIVLNAEFARCTFRLWGAAMYYVEDHDEHQSLFGLLPVKSIMYDRTARKYKWVRVDPADAHKRFWLSPDTEKVPFDQVNPLRHTPLI